MTTTKAFSKEHIQQIKKMALPKGCGVIPKLIETNAFFEAYKEEKMSTYQLIQIVGLQISVSKPAAWLITEHHINYN
jgi:hypothetical protein